MAKAKPKLLVVDDEPGVLDMIQGHFSLRGYEVFTAPDGRVGVEICRREKPQIILLDFKMKEMDGDEALPLMRETSPASKIFMVTAYQDAQSEHRMKKLAVDAYFEKPVSILTLQKAVEQAIT